MVFHFFKFHHKLVLVTAAASVILLYFVVLMRQGVALGDNAPYMKQWRSCLKWSSYSFLHLGMSSYSWQASKTSCGGVLAAAFHILATTSFSVRFTPRAMLRCFKQCLTPSWGSKVEWEKETMQPGVATWRTILPAICLLPPVISSLPLALLWSHNLKKMKADLESSLNQAFNSLLVPCTTFFQRRRFSESLSNDCANTVKCSKIGYLCISNGHSRMEKPTMDLFEANDEEVGQCAEGQDIAKSGGSPGMMVGATLQSVTIFPIFLWPAGASSGEWWAWNPIGRNRKGQEGGPRRHVEPTSFWLGGGLSGGRR